jgi:hypothetical protein
MRTLSKRAEAARKGLRAFYDFQFFMTDYPQGILCDCTFEICISSSCTRHHKILVRLQKEINQKRSVLAKIPHKILCFVPRRHVRNTCASRTFSCCALQECRKVLIIINYLRYKSDCFSVDELPNAIKVGNKSRSMYDMRCITITSHHKQTIKLMAEKKEDIKREKLFSLFAQLETEGRVLSEKKKEGI